MKLGAWFKSRNFELINAEPGTDDWRDYHSILRRNLYCQNELEYDPILQDSYPHYPHKRHFLLLRDAGRPVGAARLNVISSNDARLSLIAVEGDAQGQGYGARLVSELTRHCAGAGITTIYVHADREARHFYEKQGFVPHIFDPGIFTDESVVGYTAVQMRKDVPSPARTFHARADGEKGHEKDRDAFRPIR